jgi:hypothetical protein
MIVTIDADMMKAMTADAWESLQAELGEQIDAWRSNPGGVLFLGEGINVELIDLAAIAPGKRVCVI